MNEGIFRGKGEEPQKLLVKISSQVHDFIQFGIGPERMEVLNVSRYITDEGETLFVDAARNGSVAGTGIGWILVLRPENIKRCGAIMIDPSPSVEVAKAWGQGMHSSIVKTLAN
ncbi:hypothetical protein Sjap_011255 [Stephania japonica]|uniref:Uncharacterized protein n=1 Tax=Stephania japonica TaxID=461633 RepID=A0AAP0JB67_9MAGN